MVSNAAASVAFDALHGYKTSINGVFNAGRAIVKTVLHGVVGGIRQKLTGGSFKAGFMAAALTQGLSVFGGFKAINLAAEKATNMIERIKNAAAAAIIGGTASVIGGGKFANGAVTAAFSRLFNDLKIKKNIHLARAAGNEIQRIFRLSEIQYVDEFSQYGYTGGVEYAYISRLKLREELTVVMTEGLLNELKPELSDAASGALSAAGAASKSIRFSIFTSIIDAFRVISMMFTTDSYKFHYSCQRADCYLDGYSKH